MFDDATILVTGGTGSFGHEFTRLVLREHNPRDVIVFSRDEKKQHDMRISICDERLSFVIGDIRDGEQICRATTGFTSGQCACIVFKCTLFIWSTCDFLMTASHWF